MRPRSFLHCFLPALLITLSLVQISSAAVWPWSLSLPGKSLHKESAPDYPRAFLWIPPTCQHVKGIVLSQNNMEEESILEDAHFRQTLTDLDFAEVWVTPDMGSIHFRFDQGEGDLLEKMLKDLGTISGYQELEFAPLVPMGHSAMASFGWDVAAWNPARTLAVISLSGQWPFYKDASSMNVNSSPEWGNRTIDGVPGLTTKGEYEIGGNTDGWYFHLKGDSFKKYPNTVFTQVIEPGGGHFNASDEKIALICLYLRKAAQYRLPENPLMTGPVSLTPINPRQTGWLFDVWHLHQGSASPAAPVADYQGNRDQAFWAFDQEMVKAIEDFQGKFRGKANVLIGFRQKDGLTPPHPDHGMVHLKFEPQEDGITFKLSGGFWDTVPPTSHGEGSEWASWLGEGTPIHQGDPISHPQGVEDKIVIKRICGPVLQTAPDTFVLHPYRIGTEDGRKSNDIWLAATYPGDENTKPMVQQAELQFPLKNRSGAPHTITFPEIPDQIIGSTSIQLTATSSAHLPISYYVREGPAEVDLEGKLTLTPIPPRAKYPVSVTVVATQWGRSIDPRIQTASPVERSFLIKSN